MFAHIGKIGVVWMGIFVGVLCVNSAWAEEKTPPPNPYANVQILVETFLVEVPVSALAERGVNPISAGSEGITIAKLAACLMNESAKVVSGVKVSARQNEEGVSKESRTIHYKQINKSVAMVDKKPVTGVDVRYLAHDFGKQLSVHPIIRPDQSIIVSYDYNESGAIPDLNHYDPNDNAPPGRYAYTWKGRLSLVSGQPVIAGATQNKDSVVFLILTATAPDMPEVKPEQTEVVPVSN
jgi:hypothetical protein